MEATVALDVSHAQLAVFVSSLKQPFNEWTDRHVGQGFAWRPGSVSFRTLVEASAHVVEVSVVDRMGPIRDDAIRAIEVPFDVPLDGAVDIGSIAETVPVSLPAGAFLLRCEFLHPPGTEGERVAMTFAKGEAARFAVRRADAELRVGDELLTHADPAPG
ncbi:competence protein ComJ [Aquabacterium sp.]|uniref:competence protein ComJ n=1 Tax=Aquabacterium sp. TaxID=1872578 RepID=UPI0025B853BD|nr:competence protein ComJ [Aquabacterium sp.]